VSDLELARQVLLVAAQSLAQRRHGHKRSGGHKLFSLSMVRQHFDSQLFAKEIQECPAPSANLEVVVLLVLSSGRRFIW
jgi:hypothetical protein